MDSETIKLQHVEAIITLVTASIEDTKAQLADLGPDHPHQALMLIKAQLDGLQLQLVALQLWQDTLQHEIGGKCSVLVAPTLVSY